MLKAKNITFAYDTDPVLEQVDLQVPEGDTLSIQGMSGSGKTTLLQVIAGLQTPLEGSVYVNGEEVTDRAPKDRNIVYLYQEALLFPHLSLYENIAYGLRIRDAGEHEVDRRVRSLIERLDLEGLEDRYPSQLSGGQKQRTAFGRALIINPKVLLLDEPFASLDRKTRTRMQQLFKEVVHERTITSLFVTHNVKEAIVMGDEIGLLRGGQLKIYESLQAFVNDPATGARDERRFWESLEG